MVTVTTPVSGSKKGQSQPFTDGYVKVLVRKQAWRKQEVCLKPLVDTKKTKEIVG